MKIPNDPDFFIWSWILVKTHPKYGFFLGIWVRRLLFLVMFPVVLVVLPITWIFAIINVSLPWVPEAFHARFPVSASPLGFSAFGRRNEAPRLAREKTSGTQGNVPRPLFFCQIADI